MDVDEETKLLSFQEDRENVLRDLAAGKRRREEVLRELEKYKACDPEVMEEMRRQARMAKDAANRWTGGSLDVWGDCGQLGAIVDIWGQLWTFGGNCVHMEAILIVQEFSTFWGWFWMFGGSQHMGVVLDVWGFSTYGGGSGCLGVLNIWGGSGCLGVLNIWGWFWMFGGSQHMGMVLDVQRVLNFFWGWL